MPDWNDLAPEPTSLIALWPHATAPTQRDIVAALARQLGEASVLESQPHDDDAIAWSVVVAVPRGPSPLLLWVEPAQPLPAPEREAMGLPESRWALGVQTQLDRADPLTGFHELLAAIAGALPDVAAILDVETTRWYPRADLETVFATGGIGPGADVLWTIQLVEGRPGPADRERVVWMHTHGLRRCGRPELEMLGVPRRQAAPAADLLQHVAGLVLERDLPEPGAAFEIGPDLLIALRPWADVAPFLTEGEPGGIRDREGIGAEGHAGPGAVVCALAPEGADRAIPVWPRETVERHTRDEASVFVTTRETERQSRLARAAWACFVEAFEHAGPGLRFGVKAAFPDDEDRGREHLWFEVCRAEADRAEGRLVHEPRAVRRLREGDRTWIDLEQVSDWRVVTTRGAFGPDTADRLFSTLEEASVEGASVEGAAVEGAGQT